MFARRPPALRGNRRGLGASASWRPTMLSGCVLWLRADLGITTVDAAVTDGSDLSTANWTKTNSTATATTITDSNDGAGPAVEHYVRQTVSGVQANHAATVYAELKAGTKTWALLRGGGWSAYVNLSTGVAGTLSGCTASIVDAGSGWWAVTLTVAATSSALYDIAPSSPGDLGVSYIGNGTGTVLARAASVTQRNVSAWADQSGAGNHFSQGTAANRPALVLDGGYAGNPAIYFDGASDGLVSSMSQTQPFTMFAVGHLVSQAARMLVGASAPAMYWGANSGTSIAYNMNGTQISGTYDATQRTVHSIVSNTANSRLRANGIDKATGAVGAGSLVSPAVGVTPGLGFYWYGWIPEVIAYNRELSAAEYAFVERKLGSRYGIAVA